MADRGRGHGIISKPHRWVKGQSGNPSGRPRRPEIEELRKALVKAKKEHKVSFIEHFVDKAYKEKDYAIALFKKILPQELFISKDERKVVVNFANDIPRPKKTMEGEIKE